MRIVRCHAPDQDAQIAALVLLLRGRVSHGQELERDHSDGIEVERQAEQLQERRSAGGNHAGP